MQTDMKANIARTLIELSSRKGIEKITVKELADACFISRQTFYYHFHDLMDVVEWAVQQRVEELLAEIAAEQDGRRCVELFVNAVYQVQPLLHRLLQSPRRGQTIQILIGSMRKFIPQALQSRGEQLPLRHAKLDIALDFYAYGIAGVFLECIESYHMPPEELAAQIYSILEDAAKPAEA